MKSEQILKEGKCCITGKPLSDCKHINMVELDRVATWEFPRSGNLITGLKGVAVALVHDETIGADGLVKGEILHAVKFTKDGIVYHNVQDMQKLGERACRVCGCTDLDCRQCIEATGYPCHWIEDDLCSRCNSESPNPAEE
jgi:hypothetical protein